MTLQDQQPCRAMLVSLGGSPEPVLFTLNQQRPAHVVFFVSPQSEVELQMVIKGLDFACTFDRIVSPSAEDLGACYRALREQLPAKLARWGLSEDDLVVDYTGGTKSMSAALVLATVERAQRYSYIGGAERDKGGVGVVIDGRERMLYVHNPWKEWAQEERKRINLYFAAARYATALQELQRLQQHADTSEQGVLQALASAVAGYRDWDNFRHRDALPKLGEQALRFLRPYALGTRDAGMARFVSEVEGNLEFLSRLLAADTHDEAYVLDLIANADRRARIEGKYEDAVARLYSGLERAARFRLRRRYRINTEDVKQEQLPEALREEYMQKHHDPRDGKLKVPLLAAYRVLEALGDALGGAFMARQEEVVKLLNLRNSSPLGHGEAPVGADGYERFRSVLVALLAIDESALPRFPELNL
ncbi:MAG TPA: TIGR02710 family CRISPR-associated CARF protein [Candidatus Tectomicrobia bacterium]